jgi:hypothetical protein
LKNVLLMTSTIAPADDVFMLARKDPKLRLADYKASLEFQIGLLKSATIDAILYADNSGYSLDQLRDICERSGVSDKVEFISYKADIPALVSRYFLEINLIGRAIASSTILSTGERLRIWKLTGRYIVTNIQRIIQQAPDCDLYINCRNYPERVVDFYLTAFTLESYIGILAKDLEKYENTISGEKILRTDIDNKKFPDFNIVKRFHCTPRISGIRGFDGAQYSGLKDTVKYGIRVAVNRVLPALWI